ncbi:hypothetical protein [Variovorax ginsengisoli]|uniref:Uncharacterized protein n=1 Tax=Variovorax ginsengisoli TaxID=363844 RepID=A0ABT8RZR5_9BURK|nr:hypothetical protein [Variovorax ginsengisoli]MDN8612775.1 hypothetical protein [Variovorax ginsengisoli]MDO1531945.1 hypothetical protein [Variovorax ginsengisoli]
MRPTQHPSNTRVLGAPKGWDQSELPCGALAITDVAVEGVRHVVSFWRPDADDLAKLNAGGTVALWIVGATMPPASLTVEAAC